MSKVVGTKIELSGGRIVAVGGRADNPEFAYLWFRNSVGDDLTFRLSRDATEALRKLLSSELGSEPLEPSRGPIALEWRVVDP